MKAGCIVVFSLIECITICLLKNDISKLFLPINRESITKSTYTTIKRQPLECNSMLNYISKQIHMNISTNSNIRCMKHKKYVGRSIIFHKDGSTNLIPIKGSYNNRLIFL